MPVHSYPFDDKDGKIFKRSFLDKCLTQFAVRKARKKRRMPAAPPVLTLEFPGQFKPLSSGDMPLVFLCHNDRRFLFSFIAHYRKLGVSRFICVDDQSSDGSKEFLTSQPDVDLWTSPVRYKDARRGKAWREELFAIYGKDRWYLNVDSDEYLLYDGCFETPLPILIKKLESMKTLRLPAPMIDMYPADIEAATFDGDDDKMPWTVADCFDAHGYRVVRNSRFYRIRGGVRRRVFNAEVDLTKYPLIYWDDECSLGDNIHQPIPFSRNFSPISMVLLHFKFFSDFQERTATAVEEGQHFGGAREYRKIMDTISVSKTLNFFSEHSVRYENPRQFVDLGFMRSFRPK
jgi:hypothetical protein